MKTVGAKAKYISISNILHLLSSPASIPHVEAVLASLVVVPPSNSRFSFVRDFHLPRSLPLQTIGLHHMEGRFLHLLTLLKKKFPLDHHLDTQKVTHRTRRPLQSSSDPEMKRIHLDPSLCLSPFSSGGRRNVLPIRSLGSKVGIGLDPDGFSSSLDLMKTVRFGRITQELVHSSPPPYVVL